MSKLSFAARLFAGAASGALLLTAGAAVAQTRPTDPSTLDILQVLVEKGVLSQTDADAVLGEARKRSEQRSDVVRVPYVPEALRAEIKEEVKADVLATARQENWAQPDALPSWLNRFTLSGDMRVRGEWKNFGEGNTPLIPNVTEIRTRGGISELAPPPFLSTTDGRFRARVRGRLAVDAKVSNMVQAGLRFVSGDVTDPTSTNETLSPNFDKVNVNLDRAFIRVSPFQEQPLLRNTSAVFGKFDNPFMSTEIMWDRDVQFDGAAVSTDIALGDHYSAPHVFGTIGAFPLDEFSTKTDDKVLYAVQLGGSIQPTERMKFRVAAAYYYFDNVQGLFNTPGLRDNDETTPRRVQYGNSLFNVRRDNTVPNTVLFGLASAYEVAALTARAEFKLTDTLSLSFDAEGLVNTAFDENAIRNTYGVPATSGDTAWHVRGTIGSPRIDDVGQWQFSAGYRHIEADATLDLFTDSDFGLGGTDQEGFVIRGAVGLSDRLSLEGSWFSARTIDLIDPLTGARADSIDSDTAQVDLIVKF
ncbi:putative porin [Caulobacter sp.]|uniref:putative porin n=1 Tax=Caulobacter sp. TaxID=78 RepID=UPI003BB01550